MSQYKPIFLIIAMLLFPCSSNAQKGPTPAPAQAKHELLALEQQWVHAESNPSVQERILADDFVHVLPSGFISKKDQIDFLRSGKRSPDHLKRHFENLKIRIYGSVGIVNGIVVATDKSGTPAHKTVFTDVFAYRDGRWQAVNSQENSFQ
ncbi:MAG TPA: nuclear transport factor 2 family protein [Candidatus Angelobacter sp.]|nr:nuclear transport factor 2 family protein [Candidatus Angelobacter sp.]